MADRKRQKRNAEDQSIQSPAVLTGHTNIPSEVEDPETGKVQALHTTEVITDPDHELAVQGHDDPRVNGALADPLRRAPSPNEIADGADVPEDDADSHVTVSGESSDEQAAAGQITDEQKSNDNDD